MSDIYSTKEFFKQSVFHAFSDADGKAEFLDINRNGTGTFILPSEIIKLGLENVSGYVKWIPKETTEQSWI